MPYKEFEPRDTLEEAMSKLWGAAQEFVPTTRLEEIICKIADAQPTGIHAVPDIGATDVGKVLTAGEDGAAWATAGGGGGGGSLYVININNTTHTLDKTFAEIYAAFLAGNILVTKLTYEATEEYGGEYVFHYITSVTRDFDLLGDGAGGAVSDMNQTTYLAAADTDYPVVVT